MYLQCLKFVYWMKYRMSTDYLTFNVTDCEIYAKLKSDNYFLALTYDRLISKPQNLCQKLYSRMTFAVTHSRMWMV